MLLESDLALAIVQNDLEQLLDLADVKQKKVICGLEVCVATCLVGVVRQFT